MEVSDLIRDGFEERVAIKLIHPQANPSLPYVLPTNRVVDFNGSFEKYFDEGDSVLARSVSMAQRILAGESSYGGRQG